MNRWDLVLLVVAGYLAVTALVRLMIRRRDQLLDEFRHGMEMNKDRRIGKDRKKGVIEREDKAA